MRFNCAVKLIPRKKIHKSLFFEQQLLNEFNALSEMKHDNIFKVYELLYDDNFYVIVTELVRDGDLYSCFKKHYEAGRGTLPEWQIK